MRSNMALLRRITALVDYTRLKEQDTEAEVSRFLQGAKTPFGPVAAVCVYPQYVKLAVDELSAANIHIAAVANFPRGDASLSEVLIEINQALEDGAKEIDVVFPYHDYLKGEKDSAINFVAGVKAACPDNIILKVILETGALNDEEIIMQASRDVIMAGADFIKTSTGKIAMGATLAHAQAMLTIIKDLQNKINRPLGIKISGGVKTVSQATAYIKLADEILGEKNVNATHFRIGASQLVEELKKEGRMYESTNQGHN